MRSSDVAARHRFRSSRYRKKPHRSGVGRPRGGSWCEDLLDLLRVSRSGHAVPCHRSTAADVFRVGELDDVAARGRIRARLPSADPEDVRLLEDLLGVGETPMPTLRSRGRAPPAAVTSRG